MTVFANNGTKTNSKRNFGHQTLENMASNKKRLSYYITTTNAWHEAALEQNPLSSAINVGVYSRAKWPIHRDYEAPNYPCYIRTQGIIIQ